jgi:predicted transcriptional regulator
VSRTSSLGDLQLAIMRILWERSEASVADVHEALRRERRLALTTIATMLRKMEEKGVVDHRVEGRQFIYRPLVEEHAVQRSMVRELTRKLFGGDGAALVSHLLTEREIAADELPKLRRLISSKEREERERARAREERS